MKNNRITIRMEDNLLTILQGALRSRNINMSKYIVRAIIMMLIRDGYKRELCDGLEDAVFIQQ